MLRLGVLDQSPIRSGGTPPTPSARPWPWPRPPTGWVTTATGSPSTTQQRSPARARGPDPPGGGDHRRLRVGSGGVMLPHYSALKVAENFRVLETLFPGRIDLGIGRAPGSDRRTARRSSTGRARSAWTSSRASRRPAGLPPRPAAGGHPFAGILAMPAGPSAPEVWLLGSSDQCAAILAAHFGAGFSFAHFINADGGAEVTRAYTQSFKPSAAMAEPHASAAVFVVCAPTESEAIRLAQSRDLFITRLYTGRLSRYPTVAEAEAYRILAARVDDRRAGPPPPRGGHSGAVPRAPRSAGQGLRRRRARHRHHHRVMGDTRALVRVAGAGVRAAPRS